MIGLTMAISKEEKGSINAKKARELLARTRFGIKGKSLRIDVPDDSNTIDNDTGQIVSQTKTRTDVKSALSEITNSWRKTSEQIIDTARLLRKIQNESLNWREIESAIVANNIIPRNTLNQLLAISNNPVLLNPVNLPKLPLALQAIYESSKIEAENLEELFQTNKINATSTIEKVKSFSTTLPRRVELRSRLKETEKKASSMIVLLAIEIPVTNHIKVANDIYKQIKNIYLNREYSVQMKAIKPNY